jgi:hypothetical protein
MTRRRDTQDDVMRQWLLASGCALDPLPEEEAARLPLQIRQGGAAESTVFRVAPGLTGYWVRVQIATDADRSIRVAEVQFELKATPEMNFALLEPPVARTAVAEYEFPGGFRLPYDQVLNHRFPGSVQPGHPWEGYICGFSFEHLPSFTRTLAAKLSLFDDFRLVGCAQLRMVIDPDVHGARRIKAKTMNSGR